jgi:hypothetical protein
MTEIDLIQASSIWINLAYAAGQWWITVTTAMVLAVYFAAKQIAPWFLGLIVLLYLLAATSAVFEMSVYTQLALGYGVQVTQMRIAHHELSATVEPSFALRLINGYTNYLIVAIGTFGAIGFSLIHWRKVRAA